MRNTSKYILGAILVIIGILMIFGNSGIFDLSWIVGVTWPMIIIAIAFFFFLAYFARRPYGTGFLVPGGIFLTLGITFMLGELFSYGWVWPGFIMAPAVGLLFLYLFGNRSPGLLVPVGILMTIAGTCLFGQVFNAWDIAWPGFVLSPAVGLFLLYLTNGRQPGLLVPIFILTAISMLFFSLFCMERFAGVLKYIFGGVFVLVGLGTIMRKPAPKDYYNRHDDYGGYSGH
jgi:hypothetical protein